MRFYPLLMSLVCPVFFLLPLGEKVGFSCGVLVLM